MSAEPAAGPGPDEVPSAPHIDPDRLADQAEGLLSAADSAPVDAHLVSCQDCAADFALIAGSLNLADLLPAEPIPAEVAVRVQAALEREPALRPAEAPGAAAPIRTPRRRFRIALTGLAAACALGVVGLGATSALWGAASESKSSAGSAAGGPARPGSGGVAPLAAGAAVDDTAAAQQYAVGLLQARESQASPDVAGGSTGGSVPDSAQPGSEFSQCLPLAQASRIPLASARVTFHGQPAWLLVYPQTGGTAFADVVVLPASCAAPQHAAAGGDPTAPESLPGPGSTPLLTTTVPIP